MVWKAKIIRATPRLEIFFSVFLSTILTLISLGFFLRIGWILGSTSLLMTLSIISLAVIVCSITAFSISSMISNIKLENSTLYFLLSRTFGLDVAFAIGLPLFLAQALSACFYIIGCSEVLHLFIPIISIKLFSAFIFSILIILSLFFSKFLVKTELLVFVLIALALFSFYLGGALSEKPTYESLGISSSFWNAFAIFFPVVTGIEGTLSAIKPSNNSPRFFSFGVFTGLIISFVFYVSIVILLYLKVPVSLLLSDPLILKDLSISPSIVILAILGSGMIAGLNSILTASNSLKALADDRLVHHFLKTPRSALIVSLVVIIAGLFVGNLNIIAPLLSLFFLTSYGMLNTATGLEAWIENPSWRPTIKGHWSISLLGASLCFVIILMINPGFGIISFFLMSGLYLYIKTRRLSSSWEDFRYSLLLFLSRTAIYKLNHLPSSPKTWRPNLLVFIGDPLLRTHLTQLSCDLTHKKGLLIFSSIITSHLTNSALIYEQKKIDLFLTKKNIMGLVKTKESENIILGMKSLIEDIGLGTLSPNTVVLGASDKEEKFTLFAELIQFIYKNKKNLILIREQSNHLKPKNIGRKKIDVWWGGKNRHNSELMIILSYMLQKSAEWKGSFSTLKTAVNRKEDLLETEKNVSSFMSDSRIYLKTEVILHQHEDIFTTTIKESSKEADLIFLGIRAPEEDESIDSYAHYYKSIIKKTVDYPTIAFVLSAEPIDFGKILF